MNRRKKLFNNTLMSLVNQIVVIVCAFILPAQFLHFYGSETNGLVSSISQFLSFVTLTDFGVSTVVQSALYKPLAEKNTDGINQILSASNIFFRKIGIGLIIYTVILAVFYPYFIQSSFGYMVSILLILSISFASICEYLFGITNQLLLSADQSSYIQLSARVVVTIINTVLCILLMHIGVSIVIVKMASAVIFTLRPLFLFIYVKKKYQYNMKVKVQGNPIKQKWNGFAHHMASFVFGNTDIVMLTFFSTLESVSVYSVYLLVVSGLNRLYSSLLVGVNSLFGDMYARNETEKLKRVFLFLEWISHTFCTFVFTNAGILIVPFVLVYTRNVYDADYSQPIFAYIMVLAYGICCVRNIYNILIVSVGHFKETQGASVIEALLNIIVSVSLITRYGLVGVAIGTLVGVLFQLGYYVYYLKHNIVLLSYKMAIKQFLCDILLIFLIIVTTCKISIGQLNYYSWVIMALKTLTVSFVEVVIINLIFYRTYIHSIVKYVIARKK